MAMEKIKKRNGTVVDFDRIRIEKAMGKAFAANGVYIQETAIIAIADTVVQDLTRRFLSGEQLPSVEDVQDMVEKKMSEAGYFEVAKSYILYRNERKKAREAQQQQILEQVEKRELMVRKRNGNLVRFDIGEVEKAVRNVAGRYPHEEIDVAGIVSDSKTNMFDGITTSEINKAIVMAGRARIERDPIYSKFSARFLFNDLYKEILKMNEFESGFRQVYQQRFVDSIQAGVACGRLDQRMLQFDFAKLTAAIDPERDGLFDYLGAQTLYDRYFLRDYSQHILEVPQYFWMRVAMGLALGEKHNREEVAMRFYNTISMLWYVPSTPTLFHSGTTHPQMSSCYLTTVEDDLNHIFKAVSDNAQLSKWSGGLGNDWSNIRATGSLIKSTNVGSQGVVPFLKIVDSTTAAINRSGKRRGATCVYLETWHYDIEDFLDLRTNTGDDRRRTHDTNTSNWIPDLFIKRVMEDGDWSLFSPHETPDLHHTYGKDFERRYAEYERKGERGELEIFKKMKAATLWRKMITKLYETGHPWITFKDPCNVRSPQDHVGVVHSSNLCTEITLNTSKEETAVCNLGSVNVMRHINNGVLDREQLRETVTLAMRMLDNVIDLNFYPTKEAEYSNLKHRPVGLGIMGLQDALYTLGISFDSEQAVSFSDALMEQISYHAILGSSQLAKEKGTYASYKGSKWDRGLLPIDTLRLLEEERGMSIDVNRTEHLDWKPVREHVRQHGMRNSNCLAIAPTATIANISGVLPSIEPIYKNLYVKANVSGDFTIVNRYLVNDLRELGVWNNVMLEKLKYYDGSVQNIIEVPEKVRSKYKEAFEIDPEWVVRHAAVRSKWIDQSQSINLFSTSESGRVISDIYLTAWRMGLKTTYYLRTLGASSVEKSTIDINKKHEVDMPQGGSVPDRVQEPVAQMVMASVSVSASMPDKLESKVMIVGETCEACQ